MMLFENVSFMVVANFGVALSLIIAGVLAVVYIIKGGIMAITAGGDAEKLKQGMHSIRYSIVGLIVVFMAVLIIKLVGALVGIDLLSYVDKDSIFDMFGTILERMKGDYKSPADTRF